MGAEARAVTFVCAAEILGLASFSLVPALLPQFIAPGQSVFLTSILLAALFALIVATWLSIYILILTKVGQVFRRPVIRRAMERVTGVVLVGLGIRLALEQR